MGSFHLQPEIQQYAHLDLFARQVVEGFITGLHKSPFHGFSVEFAEHKQYNKGESIRHIDWKLYARTEKLFVKSYEEETNLRCQLVIDQSPSMFYPNNKNNYNKISFSIYAAASIMELMRKQRDAVGLSLFSDEVDSFYKAKSSLVHRKILLQEMERLLAIKEIPSKKNSLVAKSLHDIAERVHKRSLVVIFSDMLDHNENKEDLISALRHLKHNKHEVILFHVFEKETELEFEFDNRPYKFIDVESGDELKINPQEIKDTYRKKANELFNEIKLECGHFGIEFITADIKKGFHQILYPYLVKRSKMP